VKKSIDLVPRTKKQVARFQKAGKKLFDYPWLTGDHPCNFLSTGWKSEIRIYRFPNNFGVSVVSLPGKQYELAELSFRKSKEWGIDWDLTKNDKETAVNKKANEAGIEKLLWSFYNRGRKRIRPIGEAIYRQAMRGYSKKAIQAQLRTKAQKKKGKILQIFGGAVLNVFYSQREASRKTGICQSCLSDVLNKGKRKIAGGCIWKYEEPEKV